MLAIKNAQVVYGDHTAFSRFSLSVDAGETISILGKSGCGKTSLLYALAALVPLASGTIIREEEAENCTIMFQQDSLLPWKDVLENVLLGLSDTYREDAKLLLSRMGLQQQLHHYPHQLSGGMRQRVALARALVRKPQVLLLDEPLAALDEQQREYLQDEIKSYVRTHGITTILVTHSIREAAYMGSRIIIMTTAGITYQIENPYVDDPHLRTREELFGLEQQLRTQMREAL